MQERKIPTPVYQNFTQELFIDDFIDANGSGDYDLGVLLFQQDLLIARTFKQRSGQLKSKLEAVEKQENDIEQYLSQLKQVVFNEAQLFYQELKSSSDEQTGVRGYAGAAGVFLNGAIVDLSTYLQSLSEQIDISLGADVKPDIHWLASHTYAALARGSSIVNDIDNSLGDANANQALEVLNAGISSLGSKEQDAVAMGFCKKLLERVNEIGANPDKFIKNDLTQDIQDLSLDDDLDIELGVPDDFDI